MWILFWSGHEWGGVVAFLYYGVWITFSLLWYFYQKRQFPKEVKFLDIVFSDLSSIILLLNINFPKLKSLRFPMFSFNTQMRCHFDGSRAWDIVENRGYWWGNTLRNEQCLKPHYNQRTINGLGQRKKSTHSNTSCRHAHLHDLPTYVLQRVRKV